MNKNITVIPPKKRKGNTIDKNEKPKLRVAAYCRVSTDSDEQATSYETQVEHYKNYIQMNDEWEYAGIFADDGISGCNTKKRTEFNRMIDECMAGNIDMIITKSISRFARNTLDCLKYIRQLKDKNIPVFFEKENINTMDSKGEVLITIMASLAQQESESLSKNVKMGLQFRYQKGQVQVNHNRFMGYTKDENGQLIIEPSEAKIVRRIYYEYLEGKSLNQIGKGLEADGILTAAGNTTWRGETIKKMLKNEKYMGDALLQKTYTVDVLTKKRVKNDGIVPQYYVENDHEAIIPRDIFMQVQQEMERRANLHSGQDRKKRVYSSKYAFSSIVYCAHCGEIFRRICWNNHGKRSVVWRCLSRLEKGVEFCDAPTIWETELQNATINAINTVLGNKEDVSSLLEKNITSALNQKDENSLESINAKLKDLQEELISRANNAMNYDDLTEEIERMRDLKNKAMSENTEQKNIKKRVEEMKHFLDSQTAEIEKFDDSLVRRMIKKIVVYNTKFTFEFKSGVNVDIPR